MRKSFRLTGGEFEPQSFPTRDSLDDARNRFMGAVVQVERRVLEALLGDPVWDSTLIGGQIPERAKARRALRKWGKCWNLTDSWCLNWAFERIRLVRWRASNEKYIFLGGVKLTSGPPFKAEAFRFEMPGLDHRQDWKSFEQQAKKRFRDELKAYKERVTRTAELQGYVRTPELRTQEHFFWLACYQVKGKRFIDVWKSLPRGDNRSKQAVHKAIVDLAEQIGLTLRRSE